MIELQLTISNDGARAARKDLRAFLDEQDAKMAGDKPDPGRTASLSYVVLRNILEKLELKIDAQERRARDAERKRRQAIRDNQPSVRERSPLHRAD